MRVMREIEAYSFIGHHEHSKDFIFKVYFNSLITFCRLLEMINDEMVMDQLLLSRDDF